MMKEFYRVFIFVSPSGQGSAEQLCFKGHVTAIS